MLIWRLIQFIKDYQKGLFEQLTFEECVHRYIKAVNDGVVKNNV